MRCRAISQHSHLEANEKHDLTDVMLLEAEEG
jgi:hypothetical protein